MSISELNCDAIVQRLQFYLQESHDAQNAVDMVLDDCDSDALNEEQIDFVREEILIPAIVFRFAEHYDRISRLYKSDPNPSGVFRTFCKFEHLDEHLANAIAQAINEAAEEEENNNGVAPSAIEPAMSVQYLSVGP
jgi:hypothetical protein